MCVCVWWRVMQAEVHPELSKAAFDAACRDDKYNVNVIVQHLSKAVGRVPDIGVICGSGLSDLHEMLKDRQTFPYHEIPGFPLSTVAGHSGELVFGTLGSKFIVLMRGRFHFYEGYEVSRGECTVAVARRGTVPLVPVRRFRRCAQRVPIVPLNAAAVVLFPLCASTVAATVSECKLSRVCGGGGGARGCGAG